MKNVCSLVQSEDPETELLCLKNPQTESGQSDTLTEELLNSNFANIVSK